MPDELEQQVREALWQKAKTLCEEEAKRGMCPKHGGDACLVEMLPLREAAAAVARALDEVKREFAGVTWSIPLPGQAIEQVFLATLRKDRDA